MYFVIFIDKISIELSEISTSHFVAPCARVLRCDPSRSEIMISINMQTK
jgi:hypothetical protein